MFQSVVMLQYLGVALILNLKMTRLILLRSSLSYENSRLTTKILGTNVNNIRVELKSQKLVFN